MQSERKRIAVKDFVLDNGWSVWACPPLPIDYLPALSMHVSPCSVLEFNLTRLSLVSAHCHCADFVLGKRKGLIKPVALI